MNTEKQVESTEVMEMPDSEEKEVSTELAVSSKKKGSEKFKNAIAKTSEMSKRAFANARGKAQDLSEQQQIRNYETRMKKYNPLFEDEYTREGFKTSNVIVITDAFERKSIDVCEGAIAYRTIEKDVEILHWFDDELHKCNIQFIPNALCNSAYVVHPHNPHQYIGVDMFFSFMHEEKFAELQHIAYSLGASRYWVEIDESERESQSNKKKIGGGVRGKGSADASVESESSGKRATRSSTEVVFTGTREPEPPTLCWYKHDRNVQNLIEMRCSKGESAAITKYSIQLDSSMSASMSRSTAIKVDAAIVNMGLNCDLNAKSEEEYSRKLILQLEF